MHSVPEVIDCWFDSVEQCHLHSIIIHLKIKNCLNSSSLQSSFPRLLTRHVDGSTLCLQSLTLLFNKAPYKNVIVLGHVQDENGQKMSKSKGNAVDPFDALEKYGADAIRWYFYQQCTMASEPFPRKSRCRKDSVSSWEHCGTLMHSSYCMQILMILMQQNIHWIMTNYLLWINGFSPS